MAKNINRKGNEREFDSDLETAKALSLESLALEQFRIKKEQSFRKIQPKIGTFFEISTGRVIVIVFLSTQCFLNASSTTAVECLFLELIRAWIH